jgi:hypothetical protein
MKIWGYCYSWVKKKQQKRYDDIGHSSFGDGTGFTSTGGVYFPVKQDPNELARCRDESEFCEQLM